MVWKLPLNSKVWYPESCELNWIRLISVYWAGVWWVPPQLFTMSNWVIQVIGWLQNQFPLWKPEPRINVHSTQLGFHILFGHYRVQGILVIIQLLGMGHRFSYIKSNSYLFYRPLCADLDSIQIGFGLLVTVQVLPFLSYF